MANTLVIAKTAAIRAIVNFLSLLRDEMFGSKIRNRNMLRDYALVRDD